MSHHTHTPREVFDHHLRAINEGNVDEIAADYAENAFLIIPPDTILRGREAIKGLFQQALTEALPGGQFSAKMIIVEGEILYLEWTAASPKATVSDGTDTFVIRNGEIQAQTAKFTVVPRE